MRLRNIKGSREKIQINDYVIKEEQSFKGKWNKEIFKNDNDIYIEIGMGKGKFITELAKKNKNINYIGIEKYSSVLIRALEKREILEESEQLSNLYYIRMDAEEIEKVFDKSEVSQIYLNFSDPWPKDRHSKRRLTSKEFFSRYDNILKPDGEVIFKTDNRELFDFSVEEVNKANWKIKNLTYDLHNSEYVDGNVMTEYEEKFSSMGNSICRLVAIR